MPIQFECPHCNASYTVADKLAGKKAKCKKCSGSMVIPDKGAKQTPRAKMTQGSRPEAKPSPKKPGDSKPKSKPETVQAKPRIHDPTAPGQGAMAPVAGIPVSPDGTPELQIPGTEEPLQPISDFSPHSAKPSSAAKSASQAGPAQIQPVTPVQPLPDLAAAASTPIVAQPVPAKQAVSARKSSAAPQAVAASAEPEISQEALLRAIKQEIEPVPTTFAYRLAALFVAALMITLPFIYIGLIGLTGYGLFYFAIYGTEIFQADAGSRGSIILLFVYLAPLFAGAVTILFMIKPLFAGSAKPDPKRSLYREDEPKLFAFVDRLCETVHAPKPKRIDVDCDVNASASFRRGVFSMFGNDLVLTIGMPLVAGLTTRQLAGVLAHEFGHFSQGFGMRVSYLVRMISYWFARVVYERDSWDEWLAEAANSIDIRIGFVLHLARLVVWIVRRVLWVLMMLGQLFSCFLLRQMEFDADLHEIRFSGSDNFRKTCIQLRRLGVGYQESLADQQHFFMNGKLGDDMPLLTKLARDNQDEDFIKKIFAGVMEEQTEWLTTHPVDKDRVKAAKEEAEAGVFQLELPASCLFKNYKPICKAVTKDFFRAIFGNDLKANMLVPAAQLVAHKQAAKEAAEAMTRMFGNDFDTPRVLALRPSPRVPVEEAIQQLGAARQVMINALPTYSELSKQLSEKDGRWITCHQVSSLVDLGAQLKPKDFDGLPVSSRPRMKKEAEKLQRELSLLSPQLDTLELAFSKRVCYASCLINAPQVVYQLGQEKAFALSQQLPGVLNALNAVQECYGELVHIRNEFASLSLTLQAIGSNEISGEIYAKITGGISSMFWKVSSFNDTLKVVPYPFEHAEGFMNLNKYMIPKMPGSDDIGGVMEATDKLLDNYHYVYFRCVGELSLICQVVESALGWAPQPDPPKPKEPEEKKAR